MESSCIQVWARMRPLTQQEAEEEENHYLQLGDSKTLVNIQSKDSWSYDNIFTEDTKNKEIFNSAAEGSVKSAISGINSTIFAYGQTSSGKTYTMRGTEEEPGLIPLAIKKVFQCVAEEKEREFTVKISYLELYNECIKDLLNPSNRELLIRENLKQHIYIQGLTEVPVKDEIDVLPNLLQGDEQRAIAETKSNETSSRSHTVFRFSIESTPVGAGKAAKARISQLNLVDLAGSEGVSRIGAEGDRYKEGVNINKSLLALSIVITNLSNGATYVNYRDSKLTRLLQPALGGNAKTSIICTISLLGHNLQETNNTLNFGTKAKKVKTSFKVNEMFRDEGVLLQQAKTKIRHLQNELEKAQEQRIVIKNENEAVVQLQSELEVIRSNICDKDEKIINQNKMLQLYDELVNELQQEIKKNLENIGELQLEKVNLKDELTLRDLEKKEASFLLANKEQEVTLFRKTLHIQAKRLSLGQEREINLTEELSSVEIPIIPMEEMEMGTINNNNNMPSQDMNILEGDGIECFDPNNPINSVENSALVEGVLNESLQLEYSTKIEQLRNEVDMLEYKLEIVQREKLELQEKSGRMEREKGEAIEGLGEALDALNNIQNDMRDIIEQKEELVKGNDQLQEILNAQDLNIFTLEDEISALKLRLQGENNGESTNNGNSKPLGNFSVFPADPDVICINDSALEETHKTLISQKEEEMDLLLQEKVEILGELQGYKERIGERERELEQMRESRKAVNELLTTYEKEQSGFKQEIETVRGESEVHRTKHRKYHDLNMANERKLEKTKADVEFLRAENSRLKSVDAEHIKTKKLDRVEHEKKLRQMKIYNEGVKKQLEDSSKKTLSLIRDKNELEDRLRKITAEKNAYANKIFNGGPNIFEDLAMGKIELEERGKLLVREREARDLAETNLGVEKEGREIADKKYEGLKAEFEVFKMNVAQPKKRLFNEMNGEKEDSLQEEIGVEKCRYKTPTRAKPVKRSYNLRSKVKKPRKSNKENENMNAKLHNIPEEEEEL